MNWFSGCFAWLGNPRVCSDVIFKITSRTGQNLMIEGVNGMLEMAISFNKGNPFIYTWEDCFPSQCDGDDFFKIGKQRLHDFLLNDEVFQTFLMEGNVTNVIFTDDGKIDEFFLFELFFATVYLICGILAEGALLKGRFKSVMKGAPLARNELWLYNSKMGHLFLSFAPLKNIGALFQ